MESKGESLGFAGLVLPNKSTPNSIRDLVSKSKVYKLIWVGYLEKIKEEEFGRSEKEAVPLGRVGSEYGQNRLCI